MRKPKSGLKVIVSFVALSSAFDYLQRGGIGEGLAQIALDLVLRSKIQLLEHVHADVYTLRCPNSAQFVRGRRVLDDPVHVFRFISHGGYE